MATTKKPAAKPAAVKRGGALGAIDRYFKISDRGSTFGTEIRGGLTTFFTMAYIVVLNPIILRTIPDAEGNYLGGDDGFGKIAAATALVAGVITILMGVWARFPIALATGLGLNAFVTFGIAAYAGMSWKAAMGLVVVEGLVILLLVITGFRVAVFKAVPAVLKKAIAVGIGLFIAYIGLWDARIVQPRAATPAELGAQGSLDTWPALVFVVGLFLGILLLVLKVRGALLLSIVGATIVAAIVEWQADLGSSVVNPDGWSLVVPTAPDAITATPDFSLLGQFDFTAFERMGVLVACLFVFSLLLADFFDTMGTMTAIGEEAGLNDKDGNPPNTKEILLVDSLAAVAGGVASTSSNTAYIESASGVGDGARTGFSSVIVGLCFLLATFLTPLYSVVPFEAATPVLVIVGFLMVAQVADIDWKSYELAIPAFLTLVLMPFTFSIAVGIGAGFVSYTFIQMVVGKARSVHWLMYLISALFVLYFVRSLILDAAMG